jgi:tetratricopeptide (TPR) repeat protein
MMKCISLFSLLLFATGTSAQTPNSQELFRQATAAQQSGDNQTAADLYREILRQRPDAIGVRVNLGATLASLKQYDEAIEQYRAVLLARPQDLAVRMNLALALREKGNVAGAIAELETIRKNHADDPQAAFVLADCYFRSARYEDVISILIPLERLMPDDLDLEWMLGASLIRSGKAREGVARTDKVAEAGQSAEAYLLSGHARVALEDYAAARHDADAALKLNPSVAGGATLVGVILEHTGDYQGAQTALLAALERDPADFNAHYYLGAIYYFDRDLKQARSHLEEALRINPQFAPAHFELALVAGAEGKLEEARQHLEVTIHDSPNWVQPHAELAAIYYRLHRPEDGAKERDVVDKLWAGHADRPLSSVP